MKIHHAGFGELRSGTPEAIDDVSLAGQGTSKHFCRVEDWKQEAGKKRIQEIIRVVDCHEELHDELLSACQAAFDFIDGIDNFSDDALTTIRILETAIKNAEAKI